MMAHEEHITDEDVQNENLEEDNKQSTDKPKEEHTEQDIKNATEGMSAEEAARTRAALRKANKEAQDRRLELQGYQELGVDIDTIKAWKQEREEAEIQKAEEARNWEEVKDRLKKDKETALEAERAKIKQYEEQANKYKATVENYLVDNEALRVLKQLDGEPEFVLPRLKQDVKVIEDDKGNMRALVVDEFGEPRMNKDGDYFTIEDRLKELREDKVYGKAFAAPDISGSGSNSDGNQTKVPATPPKKNRNSMTVNEKSQYISKYGVEAFNKLPR